MTHARPPFRLSREFRYVLVDQRGWVVLRFEVGQEEARDSILGHLRDALVVEEDSDHAEGEP